ncbi:MAG: GNAT family N-acetyltransferase [Gammaproteobacteria bacterium]|nr:GNAT family N-acetyltransferase [Gammaproteobacteria bacterium]
MSSSPSLTIREAHPEDCTQISEFIYELADYEKLRDQVEATPEMLERSLFGAERCAEALIGEISGEAAGYALFFTSFSTFTAKPGIYLEDIYVRARWRGHGLGKALLKQVARIAVQRGCARMEWSVLDWNQPAIDFYRNLGAQPLPEWIGQRLAGDSLEQIAADQD